MTSAMELNFAAGLRAELENNRNRSLFGQAQIALNSFYNLQKNISTITEGLSIFEAINPSNANVKTENKEENIPNTECGNPSNNENKRSQSTPRMRYVNKIELKNKEDHINDLINYKFANKFRDYNFPTKINQVKYEDLINSFQNNIKENFVLEKNN